MARVAFSKVAWMARATTTVVGLAIMLALVLGVATTALGADGQNFILGKLNNAATRVTGLAGNVDGAAALRVTNPNAGTNDTALDLRVQAGEAPMRVNSTTKVANLNADKIDDREASSFANAVHAHSGAQITSGTIEADRVEDGPGSNLDADRLDGKDSTEFLGANAKAADSAKLGGQPAADYLRQCQDASVYGRADIRGSNATSTLSTTGVTDLTDFVCTGENVQVQRVSAGHYRVVFGDVNHGGTVGLGTGNGPLPVVSPREAGKIVEAYGPANCAASTTYATTCFPVHVTNLSGTPVDGDFIIAIM